jgi:endonuclease YncB( thermonuclease family)
MSHSHKRIAVSGLVLTAMLLAGCGASPEPGLNAATQPEVRTIAASVPHTEADVPQSLPSSETNPIAGRPEPAAKSNSPPAEPWIPMTTVELFKDRPSPTLREWTASTGGFHTAAKFVGFVDGQVQLQKGAGGQAIVPLAKLSMKDCQYVQDLIRVDPTAKVAIGKVFRVMSNHSFSLDDDERHHLVHLEGIEELDADQTPGQKSKDALAGKIQGKFVWVEEQEKDRHDYLVGQVYLDGRNINVEMVAEGHARHDRLSRTNPRMANAELIARRRNLGLWSEGFAESPFGLGPAR